MNLWQDVRYALRGMRRSPAFAATAVFTLALGIGANTAIFTVVRAVLLKPLPYPEPERVVRVAGGSTIPRYDEMRAGAKSYSDLGAFYNGVEEVTLSGGATPEVLKQSRVSANFLRILRIEPALGRGFLPEEDVPGGPSVAMISTALWQRRFGGDPSISGRAITLGATPFTIVGVLPPDFHFPFSDVDLWVSRPGEHLNRSSPILAVFARLLPGVSLEQASAELGVLNQQYAANHPGMLDAKRTTSARVAPIKEELVAKVRSMLWMLFGAVGFVLLIACANVASLLLARASSRAREFAVRASVGAGRGRLIAQLLSESVVLAAIAGALGLLLARWSLQGIAHLTALELPRMSEVRLDTLVLAFAMALSVATGVLFGLVPSLGASRPDLAAVLRGGGGSAAPAGKRTIPWLHARGLLVVGQVALSMVLLIGATLLMESLAHLNRVQPGFNPDNLLTMRISLSPTRYDTDTKRALFFDGLAARLESLPGIRGAAATLTLPMQGFPMTPVQPADQAPVKLNERPLAAIQMITPPYLRTMEIPLRRGREFTAHDQSGTEPVALINEAFARLFWPEYPRGVDPVGKYILIGINPRPFQVVGVVADVHQGLDTEPMAGVYRPWDQSPALSAAFAVRTEGDPLRYANAVRGEVLAIDRDQGISDVRTMESVVAASEGQRQLIAMLLGLFAGTAMLLAVVGIYGAISYSVAQRTHEMGIRRALGAQQGDILRLVMAPGLGLTLGGAALGIAGAAVMMRVLQSLLFQVSTTDPLTYLGIAAVFVAVALGASYVPARRAMRIDPSSALRVG
ncbi:MAG TPA: ABC transporter permease [Bryobacteraceae bacterium]|nr:ABC transporter permease [Bryobacteraceae bacterium]